MKKEKLGFFKKLFLVVTDFRTYPFLVKHEKFYKSILYMITLVFIVSAIFATNIIMKSNEVMKELVNQYDEIIPEFKMSNGILDVQGKYSEKLDSETYLVVNTDYSYEEYTKTNEYGKLVIYDNLILINSDVALIETKNASLKITYYNLIGDIDKDILHEELTSEHSVTDYIAYYGSIYISIFVSYLMAVLVKILFFTLVIIIICFITGVHLNYQNYVKIAIYAYTLPLIIEVVATCMAGMGKDYIYYATSLLSYVYMIYAARAIRLDAFIMMFSRKENLKHTSSEFEKELKKYDELMDEPKEKVDKEEKDENKKE